LPAAVAAAPGVAETAIMSDGEYTKVHSMAAGWLAACDVSDRFKETVPPGFVAPDESDSESDWQKAVAPDMKSAMIPVADFIVREHIVTKW
jgi:hypothetical protein